MTARLTRKLCDANVAVSRRRGSGVHCHRHPVTQIVSPLMRGRFDEARLAYAMHHTSHEMMPAHGEAPTLANLHGLVRALPQRIGGANKIPPFLHEAFRPRGNLRGDPSPKLRLKISP